MSKKTKGMIFGSFLGDALALGPHWVYNTHVIDKKFGRVQQYFDPLVSYHAGKKKGDFTHYGDQMLMLLEFLVDASGFDPKQFAEAWQSFFDDYEGYRDKATLTTLQNMTAENNILESGSTSDDLGGAARIAPIVYQYANDLETAIQAARQQTALTHNNPTVLDSAAFFVRLAFRALAGEKPLEDHSRSAGKSISRHGYCGRRKSGSGKSRQGHPHRHRRIRSDVQCRSGPSRHDPLDQQIRK